MESKKTPDYSDLANAPMPVSEICSMLRKQIGKNERPYTKVVLEKNNAKVDDCEVRLMNKIAKNGKIPSERAWDIWKIYEEGVMITNLKKSPYADKMPILSDESLAMWKGLIEKPLEELHDLGTDIVACAWATLMQDLRNRVMQEKWEKVYSQSEDPVDWYNLATTKHFGLFNADNPKAVFVLWNEEKFKDISIKIMTMLNLQIKPRGPRG